MLLKLLALGLCGVYVYGDEIVTEEPCNSGAGRCVHKSNCFVKNNEPINDTHKFGIELISPRFGRSTDSSETECSSLEHICCPNDNAGPQCGKRNENGISLARIQLSEVDDEAIFGEFPWMVAVIKRETLLNQDLHVFVSGGSLIHPSVVLTAAHSINKKDIPEIFARLGEWDKKSVMELLPHQDYAVNDFVVHEEYYNGALLNDIGLLFLQDQVQMDQHIGIICLPPKDSNFDYKNCVATGWGKNALGEMEPEQNILKKVELPIIPSNECQQQLRNTRLGEVFELHESFLCAGGEEGKDLCKGDGGSPLICPINGKSGYYYQAGISSWGLGCGVKNVPGLYVNVAKFTDWIHEQILSFVRP